MKKDQPEILTVIQARMGSTRLPGKVMLPLLNKPLLLRLYERVSKAELTGRIVVACTDDPGDDIIEELCKANKIMIFRGSRTDLLDRHYKAGLEYDADAVVKIPSDCPIISPSIIDRVLRHYILRYNDLDYVSNLHPATYPDGNDVEIISMNTLKTAWENSVRDFEREHTTPYIWENRDKFSVANVTWEKGLDLSMTHRWTIDYAEDFEFIESIYKEFNNNDFQINDILELLRKKPWLSEINKKYNGVNWYRNHLHELKTISSKETRII